MGKSNSDMRKAKAAERARNGVVLDSSGKEKKAPAPPAVCKVCNLSLRVTKRNVELRTHWEAKHPKLSFEDVFPGQTYEQ